MGTTPIDTWIDLDDGRRLAARLWRPETDAPAPAVLEYLPYRWRDGTAPRDATTHPVFARAGYAGIRVDIAGTGNSDGVFDDEYSEQELGDGEQVIAWVARQPWCDGNVGMIGISWGGFNGLQLAFRRPPALKAIVTCCSTVDRYADDIHYMGGCLLTDNFNWGAQMLAYQSRPPDPALRDDWRERWIERIETLPFLAARWLDHPARDAYWRHGSVCEDWQAIEAAVLAIGGWADAYVNAPPALAANLSAPARALVGPWEHKYPHIAEVDAADFHGEVVGWFDCWLKGERNGAEDLPAYRTFVQEHREPPSPLYGPRSGRWIGEANWPSPNVASTTLYLGASTGTLSRSGEALPGGESQAPHSGAGRLSEVPGAGERVVATPHTVGVSAACFCPGMRIENQRGLGVPMQRLSFWAGRRWKSPSRPTGPWRSSGDVAPDGVSHRITFQPDPSCGSRIARSPRPRTHLSRAHRSQRMRATARPPASARGLHELLAGGVAVAGGGGRDPAGAVPPGPAGAPLRTRWIRPLRIARRSSRSRPRRRCASPRTGPNAGSERMVSTSSRPSTTSAQPATWSTGSRTAATSARSTPTIRCRPATRPGGTSSETGRCGSTQSVMTSDADSFHLAREVAREGDTVVIARKWEEDIPRGLL